ncbi:MAG: hypothetical protein RR552_06470 [Oscillospiraceae bacterium]
MNKIRTEPLDNLPMVLFARFDLGNVGSLTILTMSYIVNYLSPDYVNIYIIL